MADDEQPMTAGDLADMISPGETVRLGGFEITRWPEPAAAAEYREPANRGPHPSDQEGANTHV